MSVVYVVEQGAVLAREGNHLVVRREGRARRVLHVFRLEQLLIFGNVMLTPAARTLLLSRGVDTAFFSARGRYLGRLSPPLGKNVVLRREQFRRAEDPAFCLETARALVAGKVANCRALLLRLNRSREGLDLSGHVLTLRTLLERIEGARSVESLRGYEGRATACYFEGFARGLLVPWVAFERRVRRPPTDPVNALLSFGYGLLFNVVFGAVNAAGLDPYLGFLHAVDYGRPSLVLDLMEEWRPVIVDSLVLSVLNLRAIDSRDFQTVTLEESMREGLAEAGPEREEEGSAGHEGAPLRLTQAGLRKFITQFERRMAQKVHHPVAGRQLSWRECIREQVQQFARYVRGQVAGYRPMAWR